MVEGMSPSPTARDKTTPQTLLRQVRREAGLSQVSLATRLGRPQPFVSKYETGERRLDILELREVCLALEVDLHDFVQRLEERLL